MPAGAQPGRGAIPLAVAATATRSFCEFRAAVSGVPVPGHRAPGKLDINLAKCVRIELAIALCNRMITFCR